MNLNESIFQMMREGVKYSPGFISKRNNIPLSSVRSVLSALVRGGGGRKNTVAIRQTPLSLRNKTAQLATVV